MMLLSSFQFLRRLGSPVHVMNDIYTLRSVKFQPLYKRCALLLLEIDEWSCEINIINDGKYIVTRNSTVLSLNWGYFCCISNGYQRRQNYKNP